MAAITETLIATMALTLVGEEPIDNIDDVNSKIAQIIRSYLSPVYRSVLEEHPWRFAQKRVSISPESTPPAFGYAYQYVLPSDFVSVTEINGDRDTLFSVENGRILIDSETINLMYTAEVVFFSMPSKFALALATNLASYLAYNVTGGKVRAAELMGMYEKNLYNAIFLDSRTGLGVSEAAEAGEGGTWHLRDG